MVTLGGAGPLRDIYRDGFQEVDLPNIFAPVSKSVIRPTYASRLPEHISTAFRTAINDRPGPVYVECNEDVLYAEVDESDVPSPTRATQVSPPSADSDQISERRQNPIPSRTTHPSRRQRPMVVRGMGRTPRVRRPHRHPLLHNPHRPRPHPGRPSRLIPSRTINRIPRNRRRTRCRHSLQLDHDFWPPHLTTVPRSSRSTSTALRSATTGR